MQQLWDPCMFLNYCYSRWFNTHFIYLRLHKSRQHLMGFFFQVHRFLTAWKGHRKTGRDDGVDSVHGDASLG